MSPGARPQASRNGATGVELDLSFTADGVAVLLHDDTVDRTTNGSGPISGLRLAHVKSLDAAARHRLRYGVKSLSAPQPFILEAYCGGHILNRRAMVFFIVIMADGV